LGDATSNWTDSVEVRDHTADLPAGLRRPELLPLPLNKCRIRTGVGNLVVGSDVEILADRNPDGSVQGANSQSSSRGHEGNFQARRGIHLRKDRIRNATTCFRTDGEAN
jgi:hypothetical protein